MATTYCLIIGKCKSYIIGYFGFNTLGIGLIYLYRLYLSLSKSMDGYFGGIVYDNLESSPNGITKDE